jgi:dTDP-4-dehydrorhamnose reductase
MSVVVLGAGGMLGRAVVAEAGSRQRRCLGVPYEELDVRDRAGLAELLGEERPEWVVNCAAMTAVDRCETEPRAAFEINGEAVAGIATEAERVGARLLQVSTDYVFEGSAREPYPEDAATAPPSIYGQSKLLGEREALAREGGLVVRTSWLFGPGGANFVRTILRLASQRHELKVVDDQTGAPTYTRHLARALFELIERQTSGVVHYRDREPATWYDLACAAVELAGLPCRVLPAATEEVPRPAPRPAYSVLAVERFESIAGRRVERWREGLVDYWRDELEATVRESES